MNGQSCVSPAGGSRAWAVIAIVALCIGPLACSSDGPTAPNGGPATVQFRYLAATAIDPAVQAQNPNCVAAAGNTHIHPSWHEFARIDMNAGNGEWTITLDDVPTGQDLSIRISDPNVCAQNATGAATENVFANGVRLTRIVPTPGSGTEPGLAFAVDAAGNVTS